MFLKFDSAIFSFLKFDRATPGTSHQGSHMCKLGRLNVARVHLDEALEKKENSSGKFYFSDTL